jgi:hypothetical protein
MTVHKNSTKLQTENRLVRATQVLELGRWFIVQV